MRVVIERAPADAPGVSIVRSQLVVNARVAQGVFGHALHLVKTLSGILVPDELGIEIERVIGRLQREIRGDRRGAGFAPGSGGRGGYRHPKGCLDLWRLGGDS